MSIGRNSDKQFFIFYYVLGTYIVEHGLPKLIKGFYEFCDVNIFEDITVCLELEEDKW